MVRLHNHQSLFYKVFKEKLLSNGTSGGGKGEFKSILSSYAWESILKEIEMLSKGAKFIAHTLLYTHLHT